MTTILCGDERALTLNGWVSERSSGLQKNLLCWWCWYD